MSKIPIIKRGENLEFVFTLGGEDPAGWVCEMQLKQFPEDELPLLNRIIPLTRKLWIGSITSTETAELLPQGNSPFYIIGLLTNAATDQERQEDKRFHVSPAWA